MQPPDSSEAIDKGSASMFDMPPSPMSGLFDKIAAMAKRGGRKTPVDNMREAIKLLEEIREKDPERTGKYVSMAISVLRGGPSSLETNSDRNSSKSTDKGLY